MKILLPVDASELSLETIEQAAMLLDKRAAEIHLLTVIVPVTAEVPWGFYVADEREEADAILRNAKQMARKYNLNVVQADAILFQEPSFAICDYAKRHAIELIVMGSHGHGGLTRVLVGSVSDAVFHQAEQPVIVIRHDQAHTLAISHADQLHFNPIK